MSLSPRRGRQCTRLQTVNHDDSSIARSAGSGLFFNCVSWGFASLHPRLYAAARFAGFDHWIESAKGAKCNSLGQRPRTGVRNLRER